VAHGAAEAPERRQHLLVAEVRIAPAGVREHEDPRAVDRRPLKSRGDAADLRVAQYLREGTIERHADERDNVRPEPVDFALENPPALQILRRP
jgi:hypothetical protein